MTKRTLFLFAVALMLLACSGSDEHEDSSSSSTPSSSSTLASDDIQYWVGEGENRAMLILQWNDEKSPDALAWGYRWNAGETKYGYDMINDIAKADKRLFYIKIFDLGMGYAIGGLGFDASSDNNIQLNNGGPCESPIGGSVDADGYDFDDWVLCDDTNARWQAGWYVGYWSYWVSDNDSKWEYSGLGASSRELMNNSVDAWYFDINLNDPELSTYYRCMAEPDNCDGRDFFGTIISVMPPRP
jgi:hypothetical protein